ncbi:hypothetical protein [Benzoatithermus flavus]|uniref:Uncharacterized protein n=1 Tax=Benzoatithermus flavus TaxID=3108223 RepID=A0ABU8XT76_9PROT
MDKALLAAVQRFPDRQHVLKTLAARDESFRALCSDLAEAEAALRRWRASTSSVREQRCAEYLELVESLAGEIVLHLDAVGTGTSDVA